MKLAIVGSRTFNDYEKLVGFINENFNIDEIDTIVSGGARGADALAVKFAAEYGKEMIVFPAEWKKYGKLAGIIRNKCIIKKCDECVCFWDGVSHGALRDIHLCEEMGKPCKICRF